MQVKAESKAVRISTRKARLAADLVRGRTVNDALVILEHTPVRAANYISKTIKSAQANAVNNHGLKEDQLVIDQLLVNQANALKRYRPAARGRALSFKRPSSHIKVIVSGPKKASKPKAKKETTDNKATTKESKKTEESK